MPKDIKNILLFLGLALVILWQMLKPGYILTLDMVFPPQLGQWLVNSNFYNTCPFYYFLSLLNYLLPAWFLQKIILLLLFFSIGFLAFKFLPLPQKYYANYWAALFYTVNPFVYERFLAGHWQLLFAYAFLPPAIFYLLKFAKLPQWKNLAWLLWWIFLIGMFSPHLWLMAILLGFIFLAWQVRQSLAASAPDKIKKLPKFCLVLCLGILISSSYWLVPFLLNGEKSVLNNFTPENIQLFQTTGDPRLGTAVNVLTLYGFWQERQPWADYWLWPKDNFIFWAIIAGLLFLIIAAGFIYGLKEKNRRSLTLGFAFLGLAAFVFSAGLGQTVFKDINHWLFDNIYFWKGFRDTNKFSALLVLSYAYLGGLGIAALMKLLKHSGFLSKAILFSAFAVILLYAYPMLGGFARQLQPVWYPDSWREVNQILSQDKNDFRVLFLPWHGYFSLGFNNKLITANPAKMFFGQKIIQSRSMDLEPIFNEPSNFENRPIEKLIVNEKQLTGKEIFDVWQLENVKYVIFAKDLQGQDIFQYNFLNSSCLRNIFNSEEINLYQLEKN